MSLGLTIVCRRPNWGRLRDGPPTSVACAITHCSAYAFFDVLSPATRAASFSLRGH